MSDIKPFLKSLISVSGLSAYETPVMHLIEERWRPLVDEISLSKLGSLHGLKRGSGSTPRPSIAVATHMDAIGLMVTGLMDGFLHFTDGAVVDPRVLPGQAVTVHGRQDLPGIIVQPPARFLPEGAGDGTVEVQYLLVDVGVPARKVAELVRVGDPISFASQPVALTGETLAGHSLDNRASVAALTVCLEELKGIVHAWDVWAVATVQEEINYAGAYTSAYELRPDLAIVVDTTFAKGPGANDWRTFPINKGPVLGIGPNIHPSLHKRFKELCDQLEIPFGIEPMPHHSGTDAYAMQVTAEGVPTMVVSIPLRYMHTPVELIALKDVQRTGRLLAAFIGGLDRDTLNSLSGDE
jgi:endoglucanase